MESECRIHFVLDNIKPLSSVGLFEDALLDAYTGCQTNWHFVDKHIIYFLFKRADRKRLLSKGSPLPGNAPFVVYRGVSGVGAKRRVRGISWTADYEKAEWFAKRYNLQKPAVFKAVVPIENVYTYWERRQEQEFLCDITNEIKLKRYDIKS